MMKWGNEMVKDNKGNVFTDTEMGKQVIEDFKVDVKNSQCLMERLDKLILSLEETKECKYAYNKLDKCYEAIKQYLPDDLKNKMINNIDDTITELFILYGEHFYKQGYNDGKKHVSMFNKFLSWFKNGFVH